MKKILPAFMFLASLPFGFAAFAQPQTGAPTAKPDLSSPTAISVISANGFVCGKEKNLVTCKGPLPDGKGSITGSGHDMVYLTISTTQNGQPVRYTYYSDTGCMVGFTFNAAGNPTGAAAVHRVGAKQVFDLSDGKFEKVLDFCTATVTPIDPKGAAPAAPTTPPAPGAATTPAPAAAPKPVTPPAAPKPSPASSPAAKPAASTAPAPKPASPAPVAKPAAPKPQ